MPIPFLESSYGVILRGNARLGELTHFSHSNFKDLTNVHDGGFFLLLLFLFLSKPCPFGKHLWVGDFDGTMGV